MKAKLKYVIFSDGTAALISRIPLRIGSAAEVTVESTNATDSTPNALCMYVGKHKVEAENGILHVPVKYFSEGYNRVSLEIMRNGVRCNVRAEGIVRSNGELLAEGFEKSKEIIGAKIENERLREYISELEKRVKILEKLSSGHDIFDFGGKNNEK